MRVQNPSPLEQGRFHLKSALAKTGTQRKLGKAAPLKHMQ